MSFTVYKITNNKTKQVYIGSSFDVKRRWKQHLYSSINEKSHAYNYPLQIAFREYGLNNFSFEILEELDNQEAMIQCEHKWIIKEDCIYPKGYNQTSNTDSPGFDPAIVEKMKNSKRKLYGKPVCEIDINNTILNQWNSLAEAGEQTGLDRFKISSVCNGKRHTTGGRIFRFLDENNLPIEITYNNIPKTNRITANSKKVVKIDKNTLEILAIYESIALAGKENNCDASTIAKVCKGDKKYKSTGGFYWKYFNNLTMEEKEKYKEMIF